jgi:hypothetical protein
MNPQEIRAFAERWRQVAAREREELRSTPLSTKFEQLAALMDSARQLDWETTDPAEVAAVRRRWNRLRELYGV